MTVDVTIPLRTGRGQNEREHHMVRHRRVKAERAAVSWVLAPRKRPELPVVVTLVRVGPTQGLDGDNLQGSLKGCRDQVAEWLGLDDRDPRITWRYDQRREKQWGVQITVDSVAQVAHSPTP
jgi:hypothetical protein